MAKQTRLGLILVAVLVFGIGGLAALIPIAGAVVGYGELVTATNVQAVQHPGGGVVSQILVRDGQRVAANQVLMRLDPTTAGASYTIVSDAVTELRAKQARLLAERDGVGVLTFPAELEARASEPSVSTILASERRLFSLHATSRGGARAQLHEQQNQLRQQIIGLQEQISAKREQAQLIQAELVGMRSLHDQGLAPLARVNALERAASDLQGSIGALTASIAQARGRISEIGVQILQLDQQDRTQAAAELNETQARLAELEQRQVASRQDFDRTAVRAPRAGVVDRMAVHTVGGVIGAGDTIMVIVPDDGRLSVEVRARPQGVEQL
jgi:HlyD family secretion protein